MDLAKKKFGLLLSTGPERPANLDTAVGLSEAALARGADLYLYLIDDGVRALDDPRFHALRRPRRQALRVRLRLPEAPHPARRRRHA